MNLTTRCNKMLANAMQCPNDSVPPSEYCVLHQDEPATVSIKQENKAEVVENQKEELKEN